ncbi:MAG: PocR ligand-binding domain-containing protein [Lachnospiraceae bacterium]|nr:PocR ligand-binding domain-containing protein [Lachnospiraceae bacterium]
MQKLYLIDLIDVNLLQKIQDSFSRMTGMAALTTDADGKPVTEGSGFTDYCMKYTRKSKVGCERCEQCDRFGAESTLKTGKATTYMCHSGLIDFAAPIVADGQLIGCFIGGQVLVEKPKKEFIRAVAKDLDIDFEAYWEALDRVPILDRTQIEGGSEFLFTIASVLSDIAYGKYMALEANKEVERTANLKSDFLANMSHEIRTPMNAVIGMAEMALREELTPAAREYITQIKTSGKALLNIINDILDFSKIDSGKMDIQPTEYEPLSLFNDVANIVMTRLKDKNVELLLRITPSFPRLLYGDDLRIRQILINLANNAVKFTRHGHVDIIVDYDKIDEDTIRMKVAVKDTGIGIKENDLDKIFHSFQQVDSKRNRNIEGTGLGLAISQQLLNLMDGSIRVDSIYEKGTTFSFELPQKILSWEPAIQVKNADSLAAVGYFNNLCFAKQFYADTNRLGVNSMALTAPDRFEDLLCTYGEDLLGKRIFLFVEEDNFDEQIEQIIRSYPEITGVMLTDFYSNRKSDVTNLKIIRKPLSTTCIAMSLNDETMHINDADELFEFDFIAPKAEVLLVDDNPINLTVAEGLLEPLKMQITTANSGKKALDLIAKKRFDLIFMDHMMPELDGVETTRIIRRLHPSFDDVPIIALTANAVDGSKDLFLSEGMNDFVPKPIELKTITAKIKKWLPPEKIEKGGAITGENKSSEATDVNEKLVIGDLDTDSARKLLGSDKLFWTILKEYYKAISTKSMLIKDLEQKEDWKAYTIEVHALKSTSRQIGAMELSDMAAELERAGNAGDVQKIVSNTNEMLQKYVGYIDILKPFFEEEKPAIKKNYIQQEQLLELFERMLEAVNNLDMDQMEDVIMDMKRYNYSDKQVDYFEELEIAVGNIDVDRCEEIINKWKIEL